MCCSGTGKNGSLRIVKSGIGINELASIDLQGIRGQPYTTYMYVHVYCIVVEVCSIVWNIITCTCTCIHVHVYMYMYTCIHVHVNVSQSVTLMCDTSLR